MTSEVVFGYNGRNVLQGASALDLLWELLRQDSPSGDEAALADWLMVWIGRFVADVRLERLGDSVIARRGDAPQVAVLAHLDTTGWTLGYDRRMIEIGAPSPRRGEPVRPVGMAAGSHTLTRRRSGDWVLSGPLTVQPGSRWVYAAEPVTEGDVIVAPYLDNRAGLWAALQTLSRCERVAVAFTTGEEHSGQGARVCARRLYEGDGITQALIADATWDTKHVQCGSGAVISLRDRYVPRRRFLDRVLVLAEASGLAFQREIESSGASDGASLDRSSYPIDWAFIGAPQKNSHMSRERMHFSDLRGMADLLVYLVEELTGAGL